MGRMGHRLPPAPLSEGERLNHEIWAECPECGYEYDRRVWGDTCPRCARRVMDEIKLREAGSRRQEV